MSASTISLGLLMSARLIFDGHSGLGPAFGGYAAGPVDPVTRRRVSPRLHSLDKPHGVLVGPRLIDAHELVLSISNSHLVLQRKLKPRWRAARADRSVAQGSNLSRFQTCREEAFLCRNISAKNRNAGAKC